MSEQLVLLRRTYQDQSSVYLRNNTTYHIVRTEKGIVSTREIENDRMLLKDIVGDVQEERVYYSDLMPLKEIEAYTLIPKGNGSKRIKIGAVEHRDQRSNSIFHDDSRIAYFTMPSLASGAVAHLRYVVAFPDARFSTGHYFASEFPVEESILTVISDADIDVDVRTFHMPDGSYTRSVSTEKGKTVQRYTMRNVPPMKFASDAPSFSYYTPHAQLIVNTEKVESTDRVDQLYGWLYSYVGQCSDPADASITALTDSLTANILVPQEKASVIYRWVQDHIRYIAFEDGLNGLIPAPAEEVSRVRYGDCKGMSNVLQTMLRAAGLDAHLAWIGTRDRPYTFNELPAAGSSDHMIVALYLADTTLFLDGTANVNAFGFPSGFTQGKEALIAMDSATYNISTVPVMPAAASVLRDDVRLKFVGNELVGTGRITLTGYDEYYRNGAPEWTYALKEGITEGTVKQQYNTGGTAFIGEYINDLRSGTHNEMYPDGAKKSSYSYTEGKGNGAYTKWSADGMLSEEGTLKNNVIIGERKTYDQWGTLDVLMRFDEQGRAQGTRVENNDEGNPFVEMEYNKDLLIRYSYRDRTGKVIGEGTRSKGRFDLKGYNMDSGLRVEGVYLDEGQKDGKWKYYQADGTLENEENFKNGEPDGKQLFYSEDGSNFGFDENYSRNDITYTAFERYYRDGKMLYEGQIKGDNNDGAYRRYYPDGTLDQDLYYVAGRFHGWQVYYDVDGKKIYATRYENGTMMEQINYDRDGNAYETVVVTPGAFEFVQHHYNGAVRSRWAVMNAMLNGKATWYYPDGSVEVEGEFLNGDRHGKWTGYHTNGKKSYEREYVMGNSIGQYTQWFANGTMQSETPYVAGYVSGLAKEYHDNGKISFQRNYGYGNYHGDHSSYTLNGEPQMVRFYHKGRLYAYGSPTADGTVKDTIHVSSGIANCTSTFPDGTKARQINFRNGEIDGKFIEYHANGKVMESAEYQVGQIVGEHEEFYADGTPKQTTPYVAGLKHGEQIAYWNTGKVKEKRNFKFGEEQGLRTFHDQTGKLLATFDVRDNDVVEIIK